MTFKEFVQFMASDKVRGNMTLTEVILFRMVFCQYLCITLYRGRKGKALARTV